MKQPNNNSTIEDRIERQIASLRNFGADINDILIRLAIDEIVCELKGNPSEISQNIYEMPCGRAYDPIFPCRCSRLLSEGCVYREEVSRQ